MESGHRFDAQTLHSFIQAVFRQMGSADESPNDFGKNH